MISNLTEGCLQSDESFEGLYPRPVSELANCHCTPLEVVSALPCSWPAMILYEYWISVVESVNIAWPPPAMLLRLPC
ncbi:hypothetical protein [Niabella hibiscisoli]|uniref:hypothetical protein n=1 Tax=Niabella hibiscisoli TaxID=1825928 RepID=UPI001F0D915C|nr:hypothetical protein [Niabella hibiscisoli]MCH5719517.1 hypothetical protein [Niabella hibiscisoli]